MLQADLETYTNEKRDSWFKSVDQIVLVGKVLCVFIVIEILLLLFLRRKPHELFLFWNMIVLFATLLFLIRALVETIDLSCYKLSFVISLFTMCNCVLFTKNAIVLIEMAF